MLVGQDITTTLLGSKYPVVQSLVCYLTEILDIGDADKEEGPVPRRLVTMVDSSAFQEFMTITMIAAKETIGTRLKIFDSPCLSMKEVVSQAQQRQRTYAKPLGRKTKQDQQQDMTPKPLNLRKEVVSALCTPEWDQLLQRIGVDPILHLLANTSIFVPLPNRCLCQLTGEPIIWLPSKDRPVSTQSSSHVPMKRTRSETLTASSAPNPYKRKKLHERTGVFKPKQGPLSKQLTPQDVNIVRSRIFFSRPGHHNDVLIVGLPAKHALSRIHPSYATKSRPPHGHNPDNDPIKQAGHVRHFSKYIFPGQYGLQTPFQFESTRKGQYPEYLDRDREILSLGSCKTPKRLREILPLIDKLIWRHKKCNYKALRDIACPTKIKEQGKTLQEDVILELMSEQSIQLATQPSLRLNDVSMDSNGDVISAFGSTQAIRHAQGKPRFTEFECSHYEVSRFAALVTDAVIPKAFWGNNHNYTLVLDNVKRFIECRRYETVSMHHLLQGFKTAECEWLMPPGDKAKTQGRVSVSDALKRRELLEEFMFWYFDGFLIPLIKTTFYVTESSAFRNRILYFRHDDWQTLCAPLTKRLIENTFEAIDEKRHAEEAVRQRKLGYSFVRLLPKDTGVRPIVNLRGPKAQSGVGSRPGRSINQILQGAFDILTYERTTRAHLLGASVLGPDQIYVQLRNFKETLPRINGELPKLYFVKVDVQACFDTIEQTKLLEILRDLLSEDRYSIFKYGQSQYSAGRVKTLIKRKAQPYRAEEVHFLKHASDLARELWNVVVVGLPLSKDDSKRKRSDILALLQEHITENIVKIGGHYYKQKIGIPQGSILSTILCSFFYGDLERKHERFRQLRSDPGSLLLRLVDDYLFVTTSLPNAELFLDMMNQGHEEYGCFIGKDKTLTNLDYDAQIMNVVEPSAKRFPWCGHLINMKDLSVTMDYSRYASWGIVNTLTVDKGRKPGAIFLQKMLLLARAKCHVIYTDARLNPQMVVYMNIYQNMLLAAMKMQEYIRDAKLLTRGNAAFINKAIDQVVKSSYSSIKQQVKRKAKLNHGKEIPCEIEKSPALWLGYHAFHHVLSRKSQVYRSVLPLLEKELQRVQCKGFKRRFRRLVIEGQSAFDFVGTSGAI